MSDPKIEKKEPEKTTDPATQTKEEALEKTKQAAYNPLPPKDTQRPDADKRVAK